MTPAKAHYPAPGGNVCSTPVEIPAAARARWLGEVAETLERAEILLKRLKVQRQDADLIVEVELRIAIAKREIESLRINRFPRDTGPRWTDFPPWEQAEPPGA
jgi:hypothetical protein